jgi:nucleoid-associated protein YgaU
MTTFPNSPRLLKAGIVLVDPDNATPLRIITLQYNPETLSRSLQPQAVKEGGDRAEATRLTGPPVETFKFDAVIDATDQLEFPDKNPDAVQVGIQPQLSALETIVYPFSQQLFANNASADQGMLEILPMIAPLPLFVWSKKRVVPVRITDFSITEEGEHRVARLERDGSGIQQERQSVHDLPEEQGRYGKNGPRGVEPNGPGESFMSDPSLALQALLQPGGLSTSLFAPNSRYQGIATATLTTPDGRVVTYVLRRFIAPPEQFKLLQEHTVVEGDRLDTIAAKYLGDPEQFWRIADANGAMRPEELTDAIGDKLHITLPQGIGG